MAQGIVAKIINIKHGSQGRSGSAQIGSSIEYITNSEKCDLKMELNDFSQVGREVNYVTNDVKTLNGLYIGCRQISDINHAVDEMMQVKEFYGKVSGRVAMHGIISLDAEESGIENAGKLMMLADDLMKEIFPEHQVVYAVHANTDNLHVHFVVNTVGLDGRKIHMDQDFMKVKFQPTINRLAVKYGFTPNEQWKKEKEEEKLSIAERKIGLRALIDEAIEKSNDFDTFIDCLRKEGVSVNVGKYLSLKSMDMVKAMRSYQLGSNYTIDAVKERLKTKMDPFESRMAGTYAANIERKELISFVPNVVKKYNEMTDEEKKKAIHMLRMGRNPWMIKIQGNWQMRRASEELTRLAAVSDMIAFFSPSNNPVEAMEEIVNRQKLISAEIKEIREILKRYKPQIDLYEQSKIYMKKAYLYEFANMEEYQEDYLKYKELADRILQGYGKTIDEVAEFAENERAQLLYAQAQRNELSAQYKAIKEHVMKSQVLGNKETVNLFTAIGHSEAKNEAYLYGTLRTRVVYLSSEDSDGLYLKVMTLPAQIDGKNTVVTEVTVFNEDGKELHSFSSKDISTKEFNEEIKELRDQYGFKKCIIHKEESEIKKVHEESRKMSR